MNALKKVCWEFYVSFFFTMLSHWVISVDGSWDDIMETVDFLLFSGSPVKPLHPLGCAQMKESKFKTCSVPFHGMAVDGHQGLPERTRKDPSCRNLASLQLVVSFNSPNSRGWTWWPHLNLSLAHKNSDKIWQLSWRQIFFFLSLFWD